MSDNASVSNTRRYSTSHVAEEHDFAIPAKLVQNHAVSDESQRFARPLGRNVGGGGGVVKATVSSRKSFKVIDFFLD